MQANNSLTIRNEHGAKIGEAYVGSQAMTFGVRTAKLIDLRKSIIQDWIFQQLQQCATPELKREFMDQTVTVADEYRY